MNIPIEIVTALFTTILALNGWTLIEVVRLKVKVAVLTARVFHGKKKTEEEEEE